MSEGNGELEKSLWESAKKLRGPVDPSEYKDYSLGLLFLKSMSESFEDRREELKEKTEDPDSRYYTEDEKEKEYILNDKDEYTKENVFYIPEEARWGDLVEKATDPQIGKKIDDAMRAIEEENPRLKNMLPKQYSRSTLPHDSLENLINLYNNVDLNNGNEDEDVFGRIYEYFIKQFAMQGGQKGGEFYTPKSVVELMVEILEPYEGRIFDPFGGSGGMFVQSQKFIESHGGDTDKISIYGQEINEDTWRICQMNLYLRGLDGNIKLGDSIKDDQHKGLKADYVITNPPFNMEDWGRNSVAEDDPRFRYGVPPASKQGGNYAFIQHMLHHTNETGMVATVMANGAMSTQGKEGKIRKKLIEDDFLDVVISMPQDLFYTTGIPACIFVLSKSKKKDEYRDREGETLFIDARDEYESISRSQNKFGSEHIKKIADKVAAYRGREGAEDYEDEKGFCKVSEKEEIEDNRYIVTPGRYVGIKEEDGDEEPFEKKIERLAADLRENFQKSNEIQEEIEDNLEEIGF